MTYDSRTWTGRYERQRRNHDFGLYIHIGYHAAWDARGITVSFGYPDKPPLPGESRFRYSNEWRFPWWIQPDLIRGRMDRFWWMRKFRKYTRFGLD